MFQYNRGWFPFIQLLMLNIVKVIMIILIKSLQTVSCFISLEPYYFVFCWKKSPPLSDFTVFITWCYYHSFLQFHWTTFCLSQTVTLWNFWYYFRWQWKKLVCTWKLPQVVMTLIWLQGGSLLQSLTQTKSSMQMQMSPRRKMDYYHFIDWISPGCFPVRLSVSLSRYSFCRSVFFLTLLSRLVLIHS